jgi:alkanesulfonate monooxygenase SsuD/methylene tetrahydromethanopterin reductase-like flavin-dependent oxidoreductase (luciferase family)
VGGDRHDRSWEAAGVPKSERGRRLDDALAVLPDLIAGKDVDGVQLAPGATVPEIVVGGMSDAAVRRANEHDGWFLLPFAPDAVAEVAHRVARITASTQLAIEGGRSLPPQDEIVRAMVDPDGVYGMPAEAVPQFLVRGRPDVVAQRLAAYRDAGAERVVATLVAGDWPRQAELLAEAASLVPTTGRGSASR